MKILVLSDQELESLWDYFDKSKIEGYELILSCGDLKPEYLSFLATFTSAPVVFVRGNHDSRYDQKPPEGCIDAEDQIICVKGLRILGLGGSMRYKEGHCMYTEEEMAKRIKKLQRMIRKNGGFDILLTHAPAKGLGDLEDLPHRGFQAFLDLMDEYHPKLMVHGHVHANYGRKNFQRVRQYGDTQIVNGYQKYSLEIEVPEGTAEERTLSEKNGFLSLFHKVWKKA